ncbi:MAG TPA: thiamine pyrophosphate-dependent enzyme [Gammaproteobacteria bacterium]
MSGGEALVRAAMANGITTLFGLPGAQIYPLFDAAQRLGLRLVVPRHEQTAGYMALGAAKATGLPAAFAVVPGPGVLNAAAALCTARGTCSPVVALVGQVPSSYLGKGRGHLHELPDQRATLASFLKDALRAPSAAEASAVVNRAFRTARSGRPGPVAVEMCWDDMAITMPATIEPPAPLDPPPEPDPDAVEAAAALIAAARKPMIMCGAGAQHAAAEVQALAELLCAPVTAFRSGRGVVPEDHPLGVAAVAARELWDDVDLLIGVGSRLEMPYGRWGDMMRYAPEPQDGRKLVRIDIDPAEMTRFRPHVGIVADAAVACRQLVERLERRVDPDRNRVAEIAAAKATAARLIERIQPQAEYLRVIRAAVPRDGFLVPEVSQVGFTSYTGAYPVLAPRTYVTEGHQGTLGFGFPTALGVKVACPERVVVSVTGDGGFAFALAELATAAQYRIATVTLLFNNGAYANVLRDQQTLFEGRVAGALLENPDFVRLAESFGVAARRVRTPAELAPALDAALASDAPALIEIALERGSETSPWPLIHMPRRPSAVL